MVTKRTVFIKLNSRSHINDFKYGRVKRNIFNLYYLNYGIYIITLMFHTFAVKPTSSIFFKTVPPNCGVD